MTKSKQKPKRRSTANIELPSSSSQHREENENLPPLSPSLPPPRRQVSQQRQSLNFETFLASDNIDGQVTSDPVSSPLRRPPRKIRKTAAKVPVKSADQDQLFSEKAFQDVLKTIKKHGTVEQFLRTITTTPAKGRGSLNDLRKVLLDDDCVVWEKYFTDAVLKKVGWKFIKMQMKGELKQFGEAFVSKFDVLHQQTGTSGKTTSSETQVLDGHLLEQLQQLGNATALRAQAPILTDLMSSLVEPDRPQADRDAQWVPIAFNLAHLAKLYKPQTFIGIAEVLTLQMHHCNLTRRGIETLQAIGICMSYTTLNDRLHRISEHHKDTVLSQGQDPRRIVAYDNFNASNNVRQALFADENQFCNVTTGLLKIGKHIPLGGLDRGLFHPTYNLTTADVIPAVGQPMREHFGLYTKLWKHYITNSVVAIFPDMPAQAKTKSYHSNRSNWNRNDNLDQRLSLPVVERPSDHTPERWTPLGSMMQDESTNEGTENIIELIFQEQMQLSDSDSQWANKLFLIFGDALTTMRLHTLKVNTGMSEDAYGNCKWMIPVFGLWHLRYNYVQLIVNEHWGGPHDDRSALSYDWNTAYRQRRFDRRQFQEAHQLLVLAFQARIGTVCLRYMRWLEQQKVDKVTSTVGSSPLGDQIPDIDYACWWFGTCNIGDLKGMWEWMDREIMDIYKVKNLKAAEQDDEWLNHLILVHNIFPYLVLSDAIKHADLGLLRFAIRMTLVAFSATANRTHYQRELCYYCWLIASKAAEPDLQKAVAWESLINRSGKADGYYEMDRAVELLNLHLRTIKEGKKTSSIDIHLLLERYTRTAQFLTELRDVMDKVFHTHVQSKHSVKDTSQHLRELITHLIEAPSDKEAPSALPTPGRGSVSAPTHLHARGMERLPEIVARFNEWCHTSMYRHEDIFGTNDEIFETAERVTKLTQMNLQWTRQQWQQAIREWREQHRDTAQPSHKRALPSARLDEDDVIDDKILLTAFGESANPVASFDPPEDEDLEEDHQLIGGERLSNDDLHQMEGMAEVTDGNIRDTQLEEWADIEDADFE